MREMVVIGAGEAGTRAALCLREQGYAGRVTLIGDEPHLPYERPPLSKAWLKEDLRLANVLLRPESFYEAQRIGLRLGQRAVELNRERRSITLASGETLAYSKLILAVGARARH